MKKNYSLFYAFVFLFSFGALVQSCGDGTPDPVIKGVNSYGHEVALGWNKLFLDVERYAAGYRPGPAPRALGYLGFATYEACVPGMPDYNSLAGLFSGLAIPAAERGEYHWPTVVNAVYGTLMPQLFPDATADQKQKMATLQAFYDTKYQAETTSDIFLRSQQRGKDVAAAVAAWEQSDTKGHNAHKDPFGPYKWQDHYDGPGDWKPTVPGPTSPMFPEWGQVRTFALTESDKLARPPLPYSESTNSSLYAQALEVYAQNTPTWSYEAEWVGEYWSDDLVNLTFSPGPRWVAIANQVIDLEDSNLETAIEAYAKVGMAIADAAVGCWYSKYYYNVERPESYIQRVIDPNWEPGLANPITGDQGFTPPFPAYPSGHSTMGGAGAEALGSVFGYAYSMADRCHENRTEFIGTPRVFGSFYEMAQENAWSRVPLGVHFRMDCEEGVRHGTVIGRLVNNLPWKK
ncbi:MAG: vanadium-dependent haloperoxidase [Saprospiraceae bacterium]|nr:vanadium-dependent haloperoxidase [Saprospiraceae bacterium]